MPSDDALLEDLRSQLKPEQQDILMLLLAAAPSEETESHLRERLDLPAHAVRSRCEYCGRLAKTGKRCDGCGATKEDSNA
jgi:hypothetical protein